MTDEIWRRPWPTSMNPNRSTIILSVALTTFFKRINRTTRERAGKTW